MDLRWFILLLIIIIIFIIIIIIIIAKESDTFLKMLENVGFNNAHKMYCVKKMTKIAIRTSYFIFCCRNKEWENPKLFTL